MLFSDGIAVLADDLTGANDTALQFHLKGCNTRVLTNFENIEKTDTKTLVWAVSTDSRDLEPEEARKRTKETVSALINNLQVEHIFKKIDSNIRGNFGMEIMGILEATDYQAALIIPAFPNEGKITVGGYHLLKGVPIERTEVARDPYAPIYDSHVPTVLKFGLPENEKNTVALIDLNIVKQGAGPVLNKINEFIAAGKKLIVADAASSVDIEQIMLAVQKSSAKILPCGSSGVAQSLCEIIFPEIEYQQQEKQIPKIPKLIISGSASEITQAQLKKLEADEDIENTYFIEITPEQIISSGNDDIIQRAVNNLNKTNTVVIHTSSLFRNPDAMTVMLFEQEISRDAFISMICDYLAEIVQVITAQKQVIIVTVGEETSYKCLRALNLNSLKIIDGITAGVPLFEDLNENLYVLKSGHMGNSNTLSEIVKYLEKDIV